VLAELTEAFVRKRPSPFDVEIDWIHPSCRDLAIEELAANRQDRERFLAQAIKSGLLLAMSLGGGPEGKRDLPLLQTDTDWRIFTARAELIVQEEPSFLSTLWFNCKTLIKAAGENASLKEAAARLRKIILEALVPQTVKSLSDQAKAYEEVDALNSLFNICDELGIHPRVNLAGAWKECLARAKYWVEDDRVIWQDEFIPKRILKFLQVVRQWLPDEYKSALKNRLVDEIIGLLVQRAEDESHTYYSFADDKPDERVEIAQSYESLAKIFDEFRELPGLGDVYLKTFSSASAHFRSESSSLYEDTPDDSGPDDEHYSGGNDGGLDVDDLFHDL